MKRKTIRFILAVSAEHRDITMRYTTSSITFKHVVEKQEQN